MKNVRGSFDEYGEKATKISLFEKEYVISQHRLHRMLFICRMSFQYFHPIKKCRFSKILQMRIGYVDYIPIRREFFLCDLDAQIWK